MLIIRIITLLLLISNIFAYDIQGKLEIKDGSSLWIEGETKVVVFTVWPLDEIDKDEVKNNIEGKDFAGKFFASKVLKAEFSPNNPTAFQVEMNLTLKGFFPARTPLIWTYRALNVPVEISSIEIKEDPNKIQNFIVLNSNLEQESFVKLRDYLAPVIGIILVLSIFLFGKVFFTKRKQKLEKNNRIQVWKEKLLNAKDREHFEALLQNSYEWQDLLELDESNIEHFLDIINDNQYKREWDKTIFNELYVIQDELKEMISV